MLGPCTLKKDFPHRRFKVRMRERPPTRMVDALPRGLQATPDAANPGAVKQAVNNGSASKGVTRKVAPAVASAVADAVQKGAPPDLANEAAAKGLDKVGAKK